MRKPNDWHTRHSQQTLNHPNTRRAVTPWSCRTRNTKPTSAHQHSAQYASEMPHEAHPAPTCAPKTPRAAAPQNCHTRNPHPHVRARTPAAKLRVRNAIRGTPNQQPLAPQDTSRSYASELPQEAPSATTCAQNNAPKNTRLAPPALLATNC